jgi:hypothetical protein
MAKTIGFVGAFEVAGVDDPHLHDQRIQPPWYRWAALGRVPDFFCVATPRQIIAKTP